MTSSAKPIFAAGADDPLQTYDVEQAILSACMAHQDVYSVAARSLRAEDFSDAFHARIFVHIGGLVASGAQVGPLTLVNALRGDTALGEGPEGQAQIKSHVIDLARHCAGFMPAMVEDWVEIITASAMKRRMRALIDSPDLLDRPAAEIMADMASIGSAMPAKQAGPSNLGDAAGSAIEQIQAAHKAGGQMVGTPTGLIDLDGILGGLAPSDLTILGGRPSMGKTGLALNVAHNAAKGGYQVLFFSQEMSKEQLSLRIIAGMTGIGSDDMRRGAVSEDDMTRILDAKVAMSNLPLHIDDAAALRVSDMRHTAERIKSAHGLDLIVVDYLQLCRPDRDRESRTVDITDVSAALKSMAKALNVPVLALAQLSRGVESRDDKRPQLADLRDSGAIEQDADQVIFIYREEYYLQRGEPDARDPKRVDWEKKMERCRGVAEAIVAKNRHGRIGTAKLVFDARRQLFNNHYSGSDHG